MCRRRIGVILTPPNFAPSQTTSEPGVVLWHNVEESTTSSYLPNLFYPIQSELRVVKWRWWWVWWERSARRFGEEKGTNKSHTERATWRGKKMYIYFRALLTFCCFSRRCVCVHEEECSTGLPHTPAHLVYSHGVSSVRKPASQN